MTSFVRIPAIMIAVATILAPTAVLACSCLGEPMSDAELAKVDLVAEVDVGDRSWGSVLCGRTRSHVERPMQVRKVVHGRASGKTLRLRISASGSFFGRCEVGGSDCTFEPEGTNILLLKHIQGDVYVPLSTCAHSAYWMR